VEGGGHSLCHRLHENPAPGTRDISSVGPEKFRVVWLQAVGGAGRWLSRNSQSGRNNPENREELALFRHFCSGKLGSIQVFAPAPNITVFGSIRSARHTMRPSLPSALKRKYKRRPYYAGPGARPHFTGEIIAKARMIPSEERVKGPKCTSVAVVRKSHWALLRQQKEAKAEVHWAFGRDMVRLAARNGLRLAFGRHPFLSPMASTGKNLSRTSATTPSSRACS